ncbi:Acetyl-CoA synthetase-like protein [Glarea lozoyensis ATCC 20868]|uniref:Acetyl-CoA synthetase-like protein n=1 Tax=Glarea lozoyensis (strain ATCC 20868 / MF5171) TaxID=1116229 RepID=S3CNY4_GLAL2|nr:Acetyl-CoA synthetase-like protein [Glarea lozoyensis ATCC 20868]EPE28207.1 Acetyl-CoA synthetase-like protein [Glarea lozoyensis ATCC 20868]
MATQKTFQEVLKERAHSECTQNMLFYPLGNTCSPIEITYTSLYKKTQRISRSIQRHRKFVAGDPVLLHFDDHWDTILLFWSVLFAGGLPVLSSPFSNIEEERHKYIRMLSALLESPICFTRSKFLPAFGDFHDIHLQSVESLLEASEKASYHTEDVDESQSGQAADTKIPSERIYTNRDLLMLMLTSGSTGNAKAVEITHQQALAAVSSKAAMRALPLDRPFLNWIGLDHVAGLLESHLQALWLGVGQIHVSAADVVTSPTTFLDLLTRHRVSLTFAPNFFLAKLGSTAESLSLQSTPKWDLSGLVCVTSGGEANDIQTCVAASALFSKHGAPCNVISPGFGMTETCAGAVYNTNCPQYDVSRGHLVASLGKCLGGMEMRIVASDGQPAASGEAGGLEVRGRLVFQGYYRNKTATQQALTPEHWFRTGDRGRIDDNGNLSLVGRAQEVININGVKIVAIDVQTAMEKILGNRVARLVVFSSTSTALHTEQVTIAYIPKTFPVPDEEMADIAGLAKQECLLRTATLPVIFALREVTIPLLPRSALGKLSRLKMTRLFEDGTFVEDLECHQHALLRASTAVAKRNGVMPWRPNEAEAKLLEHVVETLDRGTEEVTLGPETSLFDIGFTSMHVIKLKHLIERRLGIDVPVVLIMKNPTVRALAIEIDACSKKNNSISTSFESYDPVVVFRAEGAKTPLWLIHPGVGEVLVFIGLAKCLAADDRPVLALRAAGFEPNNPGFDSIEQTVDVYTAAIRRRQPHGPYALAGYSYGAMLAFETAKRLRASGDEVRFLGSFNLPPHIKQRIRTLEWNICLLHLSHFLGIITEETSGILEIDPTFRGVPRSGALHRVFEIADKPRWEGLNLEIDALARWVDVAFGLQRMASAYDPSGQVNSIDIFYCIPLKAVAKSREVWLRDYLSRWADFVHEPPRFHAVKGEHYTMINSEHVQGFAQTLIEALAARDV